MSDCMTQEDAMNMNNKQAIQILTPFCDMLRDQNGCPISDAYFAMKKAIEALKATQWIPVSDRLPEDNKAVLGYAPKYNNIWAVYITASGEWMIWMPGICTKYDEDFNGEIVAWLRLPPVCAIGK